MLNDANKFLPALFQYLGDEIGEDRNVDYYDPEPQRITRRFAQRARRQLKKRTKQLKRKVDRLEKEIEDEKVLIKALRAMERDQ